MIIDKLNNIELVAPAGDMEKLTAAAVYGADAVYFGGKRFGLRAFAGNFENSEIFEAVKYLHSKNLKAYVTVNIFLRNADFGEIGEYLSVLAEARADGVIVSDLGLLNFIRKNYPKLKVHVSTQANVTNKYAAKAYADMGAERIVLARELPLGQIRGIRDFLPDNVTLEAFCHGAMCVSYSGRCLLSNYFSGRDSNRGECIQACRYEYYLTEKTRPGAPLTLGEDGRGAYILNSRDLNTIEHLGALYKAGVTAFKIEGRVKTVYYVAAVVNAYKRALGLLKRNPDKYTAPAELRNELFKTSHRNFTTGFYLNERGDENGTEYYENSKPESEYDFCALVDGYDARNKRAAVEMRNRFKTGDTLEVLSPSESFNSLITVGRLEDMRGNNIAEAKLVQEKLYLYTDIELKPYDILRRRK